MTILDEELARLRELQESIAGKAVEGSLLLVDLASSTEYKQRNGESAWLARLFEFYEAVTQGLSPLRAAKYLGDAVFGFHTAGITDPAVVLAKARCVLDSIEAINLRRNYKAEHRIETRIVLGYGRAFLYADYDPQGTAVDKLFRTEKLIPVGFIGMDEAFMRASGCSDAILIGSHSLKGLAGGRHRLYVVGPETDDTRSKLQKVRKRAALADIWDLDPGKIHLISGYIPPEPGQPPTLQMGNKDALVLALQNLAKVGRISDVEVQTSRETKDYQLRENIVSIGGPCWNRVALRFMREIKCAFIFECLGPDDDQTPIRDCLTSEHYEAVWKGTRLLRDYGFLGRFRNPFNPERHVIMASGIETQAVAGIVQAFSEEQTEFLHLYEAISSGKSVGVGFSDGLPDFFVLMPFEVEDAGTVHLPDRKLQTARIVYEWGLGHSGALQEPFSL